jgi:methylglutaconyl-CoA hydratase
MRRAAEFTREENLADARALADLFLALDGCPKPVVARVHGAALGGGAGLVATADVAVAAAGTQFGFTEVCLGLVPSVIAPYVLRKIGEAAARELFLTGERFDAAKARAIGLVGTVVPEAELDAAVEGRVRELLQGAPGAIAAAKRLIRDVAGRAVEDVRELTVERIAERRSSAEGREGVAAFLERRGASWKP